MIDLEPERCRFMRLVLLWPETRLAMAREAAGEVARRLAQWVGVRRPARECSTVMRLDQWWSRARMRLGGPLAGCLLILFPFPSGSQPGRVIASELGGSVAQEDFRVGKRRRQTPMPSLRAAASFIRPGRKASAHKGAAPVVGDGGLPARDARAASAATGQGSTELDRGGVRPQLDPFGPGMGEHIRLRAQPRAGPGPHCHAPAGHLPGEGSATVLT